MTTNLELLMQSTWLLSGQVEEGEPVRDIPLNQLPFRVGRRSDRVIQDSQSGCLEFACRNH